MVVIVQRIERKLVQHSHIYSPILNQKKHDYNNLSGAIPTAALNLTVRLDNQWSEF